MNWYLVVLKNYAGFRGRARRKEYWMYMLFYIIFAIAALILDYILGTGLDDSGNFSGGGIIYLIYIFGTLIPSLAVSVRRLHDVGKSGWFYFISLIPIIGGIWLLIVLCKGGDMGTNEYGPDPAGFDESEGAYMTV